MIEIEAYYNKLSDSQKELFDKIYKKLTDDKENLIINEIEIDHKHLDVVNLCANPFMIYASMNIETGYELRAYEPLYEGRKKNFDVAIYNPKSQIMILIECKSSYNYLRGAKEEIIETIKIVEKNLGRLQQIIGDDINHVEYAYCLPSNDGMKFGEYVYKNDLPICVWCYDAFQGEISLYQYPEESNENAVINGRLHGDGKLTRLLSNSIKSSPKTSRSSSFLPSSHIFTLLMDSTITLVRKMKKDPKWRGNLLLQIFINYLKIILLNQIVCMINSSILYQRI
jgi:hypothetical protein